jgi:2-polyprenyl-6-hydroxyphenyl methylase/3-demethylubiquinone-9 3-methyltransferase
MSMPAQQNASDRDGTAAAAAGASTASAEEIARFRRIADAWWDPQGDFAPLHRLNPVRAAYVSDVLIRRFRRDPADPQPLAGLTLLDVGCGGGLMSEAMARLGASVTGIDAEAESISIAAVHARDAGLAIDYRCAVPEALAAEGATFDAVLSMEVVEHVADVPAFIDALVRLVKADGPIVIATLNRTLKSLALAKVGAEYVLRWLPAGTHRWQQFVKPSERARQFRRHNRQLTDMTGFTYDPPRTDWRLSGDFAVNYAAVAE